MVFGRDKNKPAIDADVPDYVSDPHIAGEILRQAKHNVEARIMRTRLPIASLGTGGATAGGLYAAAHGMLPLGIGAGLSTTTLGAAALPILGLRAAQALYVNPKIAGALTAHRYKKLQKRAASGALKPRDKVLIYKSLTDHAMQQNIRADMLRRHAMYLGQNADAEEVPMHENLDHDWPYLLAGMTPGLMIPIGLQFKPTRNLLLNNPAMHAMYRQVKKHGKARRAAGGPFYASPGDLLRGKPTYIKPTVEENHDPMTAVQASSLGLAMSLPDFIRQNPYQPQGTEAVRSQMQQKAMQMGMHPDAFEPLIQKWIALQTKKTRKAPR